MSVVVPAGRNVDPARKAYFIPEYLSPYRLNPDQRVVTVVAIPDAVPHKGLTYSDGTSYVTIEAFWNGEVGSVWPHEVIHTRQSFTVDRKMKWFREASAEYLSYRALQEQYAGNNEAWIEHAVRDVGPVDRYHNSTDVFVDG